MDLTLRSACVASVLRLYYSVKYLSTPDANFRIVQVGLWRYV